MKVLLVHNSYRHRGGEDVVVMAEGALLRAAGVEVVELRADNTAIENAAGLGTALGAIWSRRYHRRIREVIRQEHPDVCHFHNTFPLISPSAYYASQSEGVPVVQTLHNYRLICPAWTLFRDGQSCTDCVGKLTPWPAVVHACYRESRAATAAVGAIVVTHRALGTWSRMVDLYVTPSAFARRIFIDAGFDADRIVAKPNFVSSDPGIGAHRGGYALFVGRLSPEKGIDTLASAWRVIGDRLPLVVAGSGELEALLRDVPGVRVVGEQTSAQVYALMQEAQFLIFPSVWYETFGLVIIEAFATALPVIASRLGTATELVEDGVNGLHFSAGDAADLVRKVEWGLTHQTEAAALGAAGRLSFEAKYTAAMNRDALLAVYRRAIDRRSARGERAK